MATREKGKKRIAKAGDRPMESHGKVQHRPAVDQILKKAKKVVQDRAQGKASDAVTPSSPVDLGPVLLPSPEDALKVLAELADLNDRALNAHKAYLERQKAAKEAKASWEGLAEQVQEKLRLATHASGLPLFNDEERERDLAQMEASKAVGESIEEVDDNDPPF